MMPISRQIISAALVWACATSAFSSGATCDTFKEVSLRGSVTKDGDTLSYTDNGQTITGTSITIPNTKYSFSQWANNGDAGLKGTATVTLTALPTTTTTTCASTAPTNKGTCNQGTSCTPPDSNVSTPYYNYTCSTNLISASISNIGENNSNSIYDTATCS
jgi:hypothetical protein